MTLNMHKKILLSAGIVLAITLSLSVQYLHPSFFAGLSDKKPLTVIMYHSVVKNSPTKYEVSENQLSDDLKNIRKNGYTPVSIKNICDFAEGKTDTFPDKAVLITFDDGFLNNYTYAFPLLKANGMTAVIAIVGSFTENAETEKYRSPAYSYLQYGNIRELSDSGVFEIANHSYNFHKITSERYGSGKSGGETDEEYRKIFSQDTKLCHDLLSERCGIHPVCYVYPYGKIGNGADDILKEQGYKITLSCEEGVNYIDTGSSLFRLKRYNRSGNISSADFFKKIAKNS